MRNLTKHEISLLDAFIAEENARPDYRPREGGLTLENLIEIQTKVSNFKARLKGPGAHKYFPVLNTIWDNCQYWILYPMPLPANQIDQLQPDQIEQILNEQTPTANAGKKPNQTEAPQAPNIFEPTAPGVYHIPVFVHQIEMKVEKIEKFLNGDKFQQKKFQANTGFSYRTICQLVENGVDTLQIAEAVRLLNFDTENPFQLKLF